MHHVWRKIENYRKRVTPKNLDSTYPTKHTMVCAVQIHSMRKGGGSKKIDALDRFVNES